MLSLKDVAAWHVFVRNVPWAQSHHMEHSPVILKATHAPEGKTSIIPKAECLCCRVSPEHPADLQGCLPWNNSDTVLVIIHLPWMKRESLWSVMLNTDKRAVETKGKPNSYAFNTLLGTLRCAVSACDEYRKPCWIIPWNWIKWSWICSDITAYSFPDVSILHDCFLKGSEEIPSMPKRCCSESPVVCMPMA